jgi:acyl-CoA-binding protein
MKKARKLKDIDVEEISLVDSAATFKKFFITKHRRISMKKFLELLKSFFGDELKEEDITKAEGIEEDAQKAIGDALTIFEEYKDDFTPDVLGAIMTVAKMALTPEEEVEETDFVAELTNLEKAGARLSKATIAQLKKIGEIVGGMLTAAEKALSKKGDDDKPSPEMLELREKLKAYQDADAELKKQKAEDAQTKLQETIDELKEKVEKLEKKKGIKKGLEGQDADDDHEDDDPGDKKGDDEEEFKWTSLVKSEDEED